jgi:hypothetical protein
LLAHALAFLRQRILASPDVAEDQLAAS